MGEAVVPFAGLAFCSARHTGVAAVSAAVSGSDLSADAAGGSDRESLLPVAAENERLNYVLMSAQPAEMPPYAGVLNILMGQWMANAVSCVAELGIPDVLESGPQSPTEVAAKIGADPSAVYRLMRATAGVGIFSEGADGKFSQTPLSDVLRTNGQPSLRYFAMMS